MSTYGRNFEFRVPPQSEHRMARFAAPATGVIPIGAPVVADTVAGFNAFGQQIVKLAPHQAAPNGDCGLAVYEYAPAAFAGFDPNLTTYSDFSTVPLGDSLQVVHGDYVKPVFINTPASQTFLLNRVYVGRKMINGFGATATVTEGDYLVPGLGNDTDGYWESQASATGAWAVITKVDTTRVAVEARLLF